MTKKGRVLLAIAGYPSETWLRLFSAERETVLEPDGADDPSIHYALVWKHEPNQLSKLPNLKAIFSLGAGVDHILADPGLPDVPIVRVMDESLTAPMVEYVVWRVLDHHRQGMLYRTQKQKKIWHESSQRRAADISVGIMGLGELGTAAAKTLRVLNYQVSGWSRTEKVIDGVTPFSGQDGLVPFLNATDILVVLLPLTQFTQGMIDYALLRHLRRRNAIGGAVLINAGRGKLQRDDDILQALDDGTLKEATLDVFETEPLPKTSRMWEHPKVFITPHAAAGSDPEHLVPAMLAQMNALERGERLKNVVDRNAGY